MRFFISATLFLCGTTTGYSEAVVPYRLTANVSTDGAFQIIRPQQNAPIVRMGYNYIFFISNRAVDSTIPESAISSGKSFAWERVLLARPALELIVGRAKVTTPPTRKRGDLSFALNSTLEHPLHHFAVAEVEPLGSTDALKQAMFGSDTQNKKDLLLYIHGLDNSYNNSLQTLALLVQDMPFRGIPLVISWPSDGARRNPLLPLLGLNKSSYLEIQKSATASRDLITFTFDKILRGAAVNLNIIAHSMGALLLSKAFHAQQRSKSGGSFFSELNILSVIFAAPDVSTAKFQKDFRSSIATPNRRTVVYCGRDSILAISRSVNQSDERLGYCIGPKPEMDGIEFVQVIGKINDLARHSSYLHETKILDDLERIIVSRPVPAPGGTISSISPGQRLINLDEP